MTLNQLFEKFKANAGYCLEIDEFSSVMAMYPAALVAVADGEFGQMERVNIISALKISASENDLAMCEMYRLLNDLLALNEEGKAEVLNMIKEEIADRPEIKLVILELMISTAESEDGISEEEKAAIDNMKSILSI